jgi:hypothetical protein
MNLPQLGFLEKIKIEKEGNYKILTYKLKLF